MSGPRSVYEWAVLNAEGNDVSGIYSMGPSGPKEMIADGGRMRQVTNSWDEPQWDAEGEPIMERTSTLPDGCYVGRRLVTYGPWEAADEARTPPVRVVHVTEGTNK